MSRYHFSIRFFSYRSLRSSSESGFLNSDISRCSYFTKKTSRRNWRALAELEFNVLHNCDMHNFIFTCPCGVVLFVAASGMDADKVEV